MPITNLENWKFGLDTRRSKLTSQLGTLLELLNAHVNQGGEIEKRKAFVPLAPLLNEQSNFGLEALQDNMVVFGPGNDISTWPDNVEFQQLTFFYGSFTYSITNVIYSTVFDGKAFVLATFGVGGGQEKIVAFYDGVAVPDFYMGTILSSAIFRILLAQTINETNAGYVAISHAGPNNVTVEGPHGVRYNIIVATTGTLVITPVLTSEPVNDIAAQAAVGSFSILGGSNSPGINTITDVSVGGTSLLLPNPPVDWDTSNTHTADTLVGLINGVAGYAAVNDNGNITITAPVADGSTANDRAIVVTTTGNVMVSDVIMSFTGTNFSLEALAVNGQNLLTGTPLVFAGATTLAVFIASLETNINAQAIPYRAFANGSTLRLTHLPSSSADDSLPVDVVYTGDLGVIFGTGEPIVIEFQTGQDRVYVVVTSDYGTGQQTTHTYTIYSPTQISIKPVKGGTKPYSYNWIVTPADTVNNSSFTVQATSQGAETTGVAGQFIAPNPLQLVTVGFIKLRVIDAEGHVQDSPELPIVIKTT